MAFQMPWKSFNSPLPYIPIHLLILTDFLLYLIILVYFQWQVGVSKMEEFQGAKITLERQDTPEQCHMESLVYTV